MQLSSIVSFAAVASSVLAVPTSGNSGRTSYEKCLDTGTSPKCCATSINTNLVNVNQGCEYSDLVSFVFALCVFTELPLLFKINR